MHKNAYILNKIQQDNSLLSNIKKSLPNLNKLLEEINSHWIYEDLVYRFYHYSFKVYGLQDVTKKIVDALHSIAPEGQGFCSEFQKIIDAGASGKEFKISHNENWTKHTRPFLEAFFHAKFFLEMSVKYGAELKQAPNILPSGWAALLSLYDIR